MRRGLLALATLLAIPASAGAQDLSGAWGRLGERPGQFYELRDVATDARGYVYVLDELRLGDGRVQKFTPDGKVVRQWGSTSDDDDRRDAAEITSRIASPTGLTVGPDGNVYVAEDDPDRTRISVWSPVGGFLRAFGAEGTGPGQVGDPGGLAFDAGGRLMVADSGNARLTLFTRDGQAAGSIGEGERFGSEDAPYLGGVEDVAAGPDGLVYAADPPQVKAFRTDGSFVGLLGQRGDEPGTFQRNTSLAFGGGALYLSDFGQSRVQVLRPGAPAGFVGGTPGSQPGQFVEPVAVATDCNGTLFAADAGNARIQRFGGGAPCSDLRRDRTERFLVRLAGSRRQPFREEFALRPAVTCDRPCSAKLTGSAKLSGRRKRVRLEVERRTIEFPAPVIVNVAPGERNTDRILAALRRDRKVTARLKLVARDRTGRKITRTKSYRLR